MAVDDKDPNTHSGLPWPEAYQDLLPVIRERWAIQGEIYLSRKLSGGKSGALVYAADITCPDFSGQAILKLDQAADPAWQEENEAERHLGAFQDAPDFAAKHLPTIIHSLHHEDSIAMLSTIAGRGLEYAEPWADCAYDRQLAAVRQLSKGILEDWNQGYELSKGMLGPQELLTAWLGYRLDPTQSWLHDFLSRDCGLAPEEPSLTFEGHWYPNPLCFTNPQTRSQDWLPLRAARGRSHGDLHGFNVLMQSSASPETAYHLIDLALYQGDQFLFFDHAYFELSYLLTSREAGDPSNWDSILSHLSPYHSGEEKAGIRGDDHGLTVLVTALRQEVFDWVERHESNRLSYMESQILLARVAAGLNFCNKRVSDEMRRMAFIYAAYSLKDYMKLNAATWPKHGPLFEIAGSAPDDGKLAAQISSEAERDAVVAEQEDEHSPLPDKPAIAVLAFDNLSGQPDQEYFADGVTEEIITELSHVDWLMVIGRGSSFTYKGRTVDEKQVGKELGVHYVVEGSVRKVGKRVRISAQLVDAKSGLYLWGERYDRDLKDIFKLQEEIAGSIVANIDWELKLVEREQAQRRPVHVSAWDKFQQGLWHFYRFKDGDTETARQLLLNAAKQSPKFSSTHAVLSILDSRKIALGEAEAPGETLESAYRHASEAVSLDDRNSLARVALGRVYLFQGKYDLAVAEAEAAVALNPSSTVAHLFLAGALVWCGRAVEALPIVDISIRLSPKGPFLKVKLLVKAVAHYVLDELPEGEQVVRKAIHGRVVGPFGYLVLAAILARQDRLEDARAFIAEAQAIRPDLTISRIQHCWLHFNPPYMERFIGDLRKAGLPE